MSNLAELRQRVQALDHAILGAITARMDAVRQIGEIKKADGIPLRDWELERQVIERAEGIAGSLGLAPTLAHEVMKLLIGESRALQEQQSYSEYSGTAEDIVVIGGAGTMGRWLVRFFGNQGHRVRSFDVAEHDGPLEAALDGTTVAVITTPLTTVAGVIKNLAEVGYRGLAFDIASLKGHLKPTIEAARGRGLSFTSVHPMFGAGAKTLSDQVICICDCGDADATQRARGFFADTAATLVDLTIDEHDRIAAYVLGLSHLVNIALAGVLKDSGLPFEQLNRVGSTTYHSQMQTTATVIRENPELYYSIQRLNALTPELCERLAGHVARVGGLIASDDADGFVELMTAARRWMDDDDAG